MPRIASGRSKGNSSVAASVIQSFGSVFPVIWGDGGEGAKSRFVVSHGCGGQGFTFAGPTVASRTAIFLRRGHTDLAGHLDPALILTS